MGSPYGPLTAYFQSLGKIPGNVENALPTPPDWFYKMLGQQAPAPVDTSWHDQMVRDANASFGAQNQPSAALQTSGKLYTPGRKVTPHGK